MSLVLVRSALEVALAAMSPSLPTAYENRPYTPVNGTAYQRVHLMPADPLSMEMSQRLHREQGFLQVTLCYPLGGGSGAAAARAELIRSTFYAGRTFTSGSINVTIDGTPSVLPADTEADFFILPVRIRFYSHVTRS